MPILQSFDSDIWNTFVTLCPRRISTGMGPPSHLQISEIIAYVDRKLRKYDNYDRECIIDIIIWLDNEWMTKVSKKFEEEQKKREANNKKSKSPRR